MAQNLTPEDSAMVPSYVFASVGGYYASKQGGLAGVFRCAANGTDWKHALSEIEAFTVFQHPRDPNLVVAGTADGVYRSTDRGQNFRRADFPDRGVQVWSFLHDDADPKWMLAGGSPVSIYRSEDGGASWKRMPDPQLPAHAKMPFSCRVMRFASHPRRRGEIFAVLEVSGVMRSIKVSPQDPNTLYACLSVAASSKDGALYRSQDVGKTWQRFDKVTPHGTLMSVGLHHGDGKQVYVAARYGEVFGTQDGGESWLEMPLPQGVQRAGLRLLPPLRLLQPSRPWLDKHVGIKED
jgi:photosystem II stability/assembly factor-like uncharacterized protein